MTEMWRSKLEVEFDDGGEDTELTEPTEGGGEGDFHGRTGLELNRRLLAISLALTAGGDPGEPLLTICAEWFECADSCTLTEFFCWDGGGEGVGVQLLGVNRLTGGVVDGVDKELEFSWLVSIITSLYSLPL